MDKNLFDELMQSVEQMDGIARGERALFTGADQTAKTEPDQKGRAAKGGRVLEHLVFRHQPAQAAFCSEHLPAGQRLAGVALAACGRPVIQHGLLLHCHLLHTSLIAKQDMAIGQHPAILRMLRFYFPLHGSVCGDNGDPVALVVAAEEPVL